MPKINQEEYEVLKELDDKWKWMARDRDTVLWAYELKPRRYEITFLTLDDLSSDFEMVDGNFQFIQWENEEPHNIAELIEEYEDSKEYKEA